MRALVHVCKMVLSIVVVAVDLAYCYAIIHFNDLVFCGQKYNFIQFQHDNESENFREKYTYNMYTIQK